jgi:pimeloyl-ACP methyl ester carboxylesterase
VPWTHTHRSRWIDVGLPVHYLDFGGPADASIIVAVHGLGGSALNWLSIAPLLGARYRLMAPDLAGHGLTRARGRSTSVRANHALLHQFVTTITDQPVVLLGNSMGGMIALLEAGLHPETVAGLILLDPASPFLPGVPDPLVAAAFTGYTMPLVNRAVMVARRRLLGSETAVRTLLRFLCADPSRVAADVVAEHVEQARIRSAFPHADQEFLRAARSVVATASGLRRSSYRATIRTATAPALVIHGDKDRLIPVSASRALARQHPSWRLVVLPGVGHVPQLEAPSVTAEAMLTWLDEQTL